MSSVWGNKIKLSLFGESHGMGIGITVDGLPAGIKLDLNFIKEEMNRRTPGKSKIKTARKESDNFIIVSGYFNGYTTGSPLSMFIKNHDVASHEYNKMKDIARPSHADYTAHKKYSGYNDYRGGGHFSGRLTAPIVFAGAIAKQLLKSYKIYIGSHIKSINDIKDRDFNCGDLNQKTFQNLSKKELPFLNENLENVAYEKMSDIKKQNDSVGGVIECSIIGVNPGIGSPFFDSIESQLSSLLFSIPSVKGVEFGTGFSITDLLGSEANDDFYINSNNKIITNTNHSGGVLGGIANGMPINFRVAIKPTPSIGKAQNMVNMHKKEEIKFNIKGRHDPCIVPRVIVVVESMAAIGILDFILMKN